MAVVLLINPSYSRCYGGAKVSIVNPTFPSLGLAMLGASARSRGHKVEILDMSWRSYNYKEIKERILKLKADIVGITAVTPFMNQLRDISVLVKDISENIRVVGGGPHPSALPEETLLESRLDAVFVGEADYSFPEFCDGVPLKDIKGVYYRNGNGEILNTGWRAPIEDINELPLPAWELYKPQLPKRSSRFLCRRFPVTTAEFSRGCVFRCDYCASKITMAFGHRTKSPQRCAAEVKKMDELGFKEFMLADDNFAFDRERAQAICEAIQKSGVQIIWTCSNGIRVETANLELFREMKKAGCYRVHFGFESGNDEVLKKICKGGAANTKYGRRAVQLARKAGLDTFGLFLLGLSADTEETMRETIEYARSLPVDMLKFGITRPFPGSPMFQSYYEKGLINSYDWDNYYIFSTKSIFSHLNLSYETIDKYMKIAYKRAITMNPRFVLRRIQKGIKSGQLFWDMIYFIKFALMPSTGTANSGEYYAQERWPRIDYDNRKLKLSSFQIVRRKKEGAECAGQR